MSVLQRALKPQYLKNLSPVSSTVKTSTVQSSPGSQGMSIAPSQYLRIGSGGGSSSPSGSLSSPTVSYTPNYQSSMALPMSTRSTPSPFAETYPQVNYNLRNQVADLQSQVDSYSSSMDGYASQSNEQSYLNQQLENAYLMQQLGYSVDIEDGNFNFRRYERSALDPYGQYGTQETPYVYESDYLMANQAAYQQSPERLTYPSYRGSYSGYQQYGQYSGYNQRYNNRYYSNNGQRYYNRSYGNSNYKRYNNNRWYKNKTYGMRGGYYANRYNR